MGVLSDFVIAGPDDGTAIGASFKPATTWSTLEAKGVDTIKLSTLYCSATGTGYFDGLEASFEFVGGDKEEGPWVFKFPAEVLSVIAGISGEQTDIVAATWVQSEELQLDQWLLAEASEFIESLSAHARQAVASNSALYLWLSL